MLLLSSLHKFFSLHLCVHWHSSSCFIGVLFIWMF